MPDFYFLLNDHWMQVRIEDLLQDEGGNICSLKIRSIEAGFNIMGMPAYIGYYIQHNWESGYMTFAPHSDSLNESLKAEQFRPEKKLDIKYSSKNTPNGEAWAFWLTVIFFAGPCCCVYTASIYTDLSNGDVYTSIYHLGANVICMFITTYGCFWVCQWILLLILMPGDNIYEEETEQDAIRKVHAGHMTVFALIFYFIYKLCGKKEKKEE